jgi:hypothetical protein
VIDSSGGSLRMGRAPTGAVDLGEAFGMVGSAREASHRCDNKVGWWLGLGSIFPKYYVKARLFIAGSMPTQEDSVS